MAHEHGATGAMLNMLFQQAIAVGKGSGIDTHIAYHAVSVSYTAVQMAEKVFGSLKGKGLLLPVPARWSHDGPKLSRKRRR